MKLPKGITPEGIRRELARRTHIGFMKYCWHAMDDFIIGYHTEAISRRIDKAIEVFRNGISTYLRI